MVVSHEPSARRRNRRILGTAVLGCLAVVTAVVARDGGGPDDVSVLARSPAGDVAAVTSATSSPDAEPETTVTSAAMTTSSTNPNTTTTQTARPAVEAAWAESHRFAVRAGHGYAVKPDGTLWAWGFTYYGASRPVTGSQPPSAHPPLQIGADRDWKSVWNYGAGALAVKADGSLWAVGILYYPDGLIDHVIGTTPMSIEPYRQRDSGVVSGTDFNEPHGQGGWVALKADGALWVSEPTGPFLSLRPLDLGRNWAKVATGQSHHFLAVKTDGSLWGWGMNFNGQLGDETTTDRSEPVRIGTDSDWVTVDVGDRHSAAIKADGSLWTWGSNDAGQLGDGTTTDRSAPVRIGAGTHWVAVRAGFTSTAALSADGEIWEWGQVEPGKYPADCRLTPGRTTHEHWTALADDPDNEIVGVRSDGTLWAWGWNLGYPDLVPGDPSSLHYTSPHQIGSLSDW